MFCVSNTQFPPRLKSFTDGDEEIDQYYSCNSSVNLTPNDQWCTCPKILVADDFNVFASHYLEILGVKCDVVYDGREAVNKMLIRKYKKCGGSCQPYSLVLMELEIPKMDGIAVIDVIKSFLHKDELSKTKIIGFITHSWEVDYCLQNGMAGVLTRRFCLEDMREVIDKYEIKTKSEFPRKH